MKIETPELYVDNESRKRSGHMSHAMAEPEHGCGSFYSNNLPLRDEKGNFLLVQYSEVYEGWGKVNVKHLRVRIDSI